MNDSVNHSCGNLRTWRVVGDQTPKRALGEIPHRSLLPPQSRQLSALITTHQRSPPNTGLLELTRSVRSVVRMRVVNPTLSRLPLLETSSVLQSWNLQMRSPMNSPPHPSFPVSLHVSRRIYPPTPSLRLSRLLRSSTYSSPRTPPRTSGRNTSLHPRPVLASR